MRAGVPLCVPACACARAQNGADPGLPQDGHPLGRARRDGRRQPLDGPPG
jgi:hypothetical protein